MHEEIENIKRKFLYPVGKYHGKFSPQRLMFDSNLQEFSQRISFISALESNGKISGEEAYKQIKSLWKQLKKAKKALLEDSSITGDKDF